MDFNQIIERKHSDSVKWNGMEKVFGTDDLLPMWVADMDFSPPMEIVEALKKRVDHGVFGYGMLKNSVLSSVKEWVKKRYEWQISEKWILPSPGVVSSIAFAIQSLTEPGDRVLIQTPVYPPFYQMIEKNGRIVAKNPLILKEGRFQIDFTDFENHLKSGVKAFILCNPHNPVGRVWTKEELEKIGALCEQYGVYIVSDEIHADIVYKPNVHVPIAALNDRFRTRTVTLLAPSKTFNVPGIQSSVMIIPDENIRMAIQKSQQKIGFHGLNLFANVVLDVAYKHGEYWLEELIKYLRKNIEYATAFIERELPELKVVPPEGTYLLWIDCRQTGLDDDELKERLIRKGKLALEPGPKYGEEGSGFVRMNIGCPRPLLEEGLRRLKEAFQ